MGTDVAVRLYVLLKVMEAEQQGHIYKTMNKELKSDSNCDKLYLNPVALTVQGSLT